MEAKLIIIALTILVIPPICYFLLRKQGKLPRISLLIFWLTGLVIAYPLLTFSWAMLKVNEHFDHNCATAIQRSKEFMRLPYGSLQIQLIGQLTNSTPKYFYLSTIALCEYKLGNLKQAVTAFENLYTYVQKSDYDKSNLESVRKALERARKKLR